VKVKGLVRRSSGLYYFRKGIPEKLRPFYNDKLEIVQSLKTTNEATAINKVQKLTAFYESEFKTIASTGERDRAASLLKAYDMEPIPLEDQAIFQNEDPEDEGSQYFRFKADLAHKHDSKGGYSDPEPHERRALDILNGNESVTLLEVKELAAKECTTKRKTNENERNFKLFIDNLPTTVLGKIKRKHVKDATDKLLASGLKTASVRKPLGYVRKRVKQAIHLYDLDINNPFDDVLVTGLGEDEEKRIPFPIDVLNTVKGEIRGRKEITTLQIMGLLSDSGGRVGEVGGISLANIKTNHDKPHLNIAHQPNRRLKNNNSERVIPLVGLSLEIAQYIVTNADEGQIYAFEDYNKNNTYDSDNCTAAVNKMLKSISSDDYTSHCFRHTLRDRLIDASVSIYEVEQLAGWTSSKMVNHYGTNKGLNILSKALVQMMEHEKAEASKKS